MKTKVRLVCILAAALLLLCTAALVFDSRGQLPDSRYPPMTALIISEICAKNDTIIEDNADKHRDYIEIYNPGAAINLAGYTLTDGTRHSAPLGDFHIPAGGYRILFLDNDTTGFALSSTGGDCIQLLDPFGRIVVQTSASAMGADQVMLYDNGGTYLLSSMASPGFPNDAAGVAAFREGSEALDAPLVISEVLTRNQSALPDENGVYADAIELYNRSGEEIQLGLYCLTDNPVSRFRFRLPDRVLKPGEYLVVFCDSLNYIASGGEIHANFSLSVGETLMLTGPDGSHAAMDIFLTGDNTSYALTEDGGYKSMAPSLGYPNTEEGAALCAAATLDESLPLAISEVLLSGSGVPYNGAFRDVVEICNVSDSAVSTEGWYLSDGGDPYAYALPGTKLSPGEVLVIVCSQETTGFGLSDGETVRLTAPSRFHAPTVACVTPDGGMSIQLLDGSYTLALPSPGYANGEEGQLDWEKDCIPQGLMISEVMTSNQSFLRGPYATTCDWVELYNGSKETIDLSGFGLSDDPDTMYVLPQILLEPGQYQIVLLSEDTRNLISGYPTLPFSLASAGEQLYLCSTDAVVDYLNIPRLEQDTACGRSRDGYTDILAKATPGAENSEAAPVSEMPSALTAQGVYDNVDAVEVVLSGSGSIYYTTDASTPDSNSTPYTGPITLAETTVIRAVCVEPGKAASKPLDLTYVINENDTLPVVTIVTDPDNLWSSDSGIYVKGPGAGEYPYRNANYFQDWEYPATVSLFETDGTGFSALCGIKIHGNFSRVQPKKSFAVMFRGYYGPAQLDYPLFGEDGLDSYESFVLRAGGQDFYQANIRDEVLTSLASQYTELAVQDYRPAVLYLNGKYWGVYFIREKISEHYVAGHYHVSADSVTLAELNGRDCEPYDALVKYAGSHNMRKQEHYDYVCSQMDVDQYIDYILTQICIGNTDNGNVRYFTYPGAKWRWFLFDTDLSMRDARYDSVADHLNPDGTGPTDYISTDLINALLDNKTFRDTFLTRAAWHLNTVWTEENIRAAVQEITDAISEDMKKDCLRWNENTYSQWLREVESLQRTAAKRPRYVAEFLQSYFDLTGAQMRSYGFSG